MKAWVIPPTHSAEFVHHKKEVLSVYEWPYNDNCPVVCLDESSRQLIEIKQERKADGTLLRDSEYIQKGVAEIYLAFEPLAGKRWVSIEEDHTGKTWVKVVSSLLDNQYRNCSTITLVEDHLSAHRPCTFYEVYEPAGSKSVSGQN